MVFYKTVIVFISGFFLFTLMHWIFYAVICGRYYSDYPEIDHVHAYEMWKFIGSKPRYVGSEHYKESFKHIGSFLNNLTMESKRNFTYLIYDWGHETYYNTLYNCTSVVINIPSENPEFNLTVSTHMDSHQAGPGAYDDCLGGVLMLELLRTIVKKPQTYRYNLTFVLLGHEEGALDGSINYVYTFNPSGYLLNLEGNGPKAPIILSYLTGNSSSVVRTFSKVKGAITASFVSFLRDLGVLGAFSDIIPYRKQGLMGAEIAWTGASAHYHTIGDKVGPIDDLKMEGSMIYEFLSKFSPDKKESTITSLGMWPFVITMKTSTTMLIFVFGGITLLAANSFFADKDHNMWYLLLDQIILYSFNIVFAIIINKLNSCAYSKSTVGLIAGISIISFSNSFTLFLRKTITSESYLYNKVFWDSIFGIILSITLPDFALILYPTLYCNFLLILIIKTHLIPEKMKFPLTCLICFLSPMMCIFTITTTIQSYLGATSIVQGIVADLIPIILITADNIHCINSLLICCAQNKTEDDQSENEKNDKDVTNSPIEMNMLEEQDNDTTKDENHKQFVPALIPLLISLLVCLVFILLPSPYDLSYPYKGTFGEVIDETNTSTVYFYPYAGDRTKKFLKKLVPSGLKIEDSKTIYNELENLVAYKTFDKVSYPDFVPSIPEIKINITNITTKGNRIFTLSFDNSITKAYGFYIMAYSQTDYPIKTCLNRNTKKNGKTYKTCSKPFFNIPNNFSTVQIADPTNITMDCFFFWDRFSEKGRDFKSSFPSFVQDFGETQSNRPFMIKKTIVI